MKWLADLLAALVAVVSFLAVIFGTNPRALAVFAGLLVASGTYLFWRVRHGFDQIDYVTKRRP